VGEGRAATPVGAAPDRATPGNGRAGTMASAPTGARAATPLVGTTAAAGTTGPRATTGAANAATGAARTARPGATIVRGAKAVRPAGDDPWAGRVMTAEAAIGDRGRTVRTRAVAGTTAVATTAAGASGDRGWTGAPGTTVPVVTGVRGPTAERRAAVATTVPLASGGRGPTAVRGRTVPAVTGDRGASAESRGVAGTTAPAATGAPRRIAVAVATTAQAVTGERGRIAEMPAGGGRIVLPGNDGRGRPARMPVRGATTAPVASDCPRSVTTRGEAHRSGPGATGAASGTADSSGALGPPDARRPVPAGATGGRTVARIRGPSPAPRTGSSGPTARPPRPVPGCPSPH
jgi:hypothetical protein